MSTIITQNPYTFTVSDNMNINAVFENSTVNITVYIYPGLLLPLSSPSPTLTGAGEYNIGDTCTLKYTYTGNSWTQKFIGWVDFENGTILSTNSTYSFTVSGNKTIYCVLDAGDAMSYSSSTYNYPVNMKCTLYYTDGTNQQLTFSKQSSSANWSATQYNKTALYWKYCIPIQQSYVQPRWIFADLSLMKLYTSNSRSSYCYFPPLSVIPNGPATGGWNNLTSCLMYFSTPTPPEFESIYTKNTTVHIPHSFASNYTNEWKSRNFSGTITWKTDDWDIVL